VENRESTRLTLKLMRLSKAQAYDEGLRHGHIRGALVGFIAAALLAGGIFVAALSNFC
jgi:hypothetical protein